MSRFWLVIAAAAAAIVLLATGVGQAAVAWLPTELDVIQAIQAGGAVPDRDSLAAHAERTLTAAGGSLEALVRAGIAWQMAGENGKALEVYEKALALDPDPAELYQRVASVAPEGIRAYAFGRLVDFPDVVPFIRDGRTLVPIRAVAEALGARVEWDPGQGKAVIRAGERMVEIASDSRIARVGDSPVELDVPAAIVPPGRFVVPLRFVAESFGYKVTWHRVIPGGAGVIAIRKSEQSGRGE